MKKALAITLFALLVATGVAVRGTAAQDQEKKEGMKAAKQLRWEGHIVRIDKDGSSMDVRNSRGIERRIHWTTDTQWTKLNKPVADNSEFKDESRVICLGKADEKGDFVASRIDLRLPR